jgi:hypothetical protein
MSILDTFQKNYETLKNEFTEYKDYHDTMITVIPSIMELLDSLFLEDNVKKLANYALLKEDYLDVIKRTLEPENYRDVKFEAELPDIYDAPRKRKEKSQKITKLRNKRVTTLPARISVSDRNHDKTSESTESTGSAEGEQGTKPVTTAVALPPTTGSAATTIPKKTKIPLTEDPKIDKALKAFAEEGKRLYNYKSPLTVGSTGTGAGTGTGGTGGASNGVNNPGNSGPPDKIIVELPGEAKAYLHNDGQITDFNNGRQLGHISANGVVTLNNAELGKIQLVDRDESKYLPLTNNYGKVI